LAAQVRQQKPTHRREPRENQALGEELSHEAASLGADRQTNHHLAAPSECADEQQIPNVCARDQQHEAHDHKRETEGREERARVVERVLP
jgi:hypothetical protein